MTIGQIWGWGRGPALACSKTVHRQARFARLQRPVMAQCDADKAAAATSAQSAGPGHEPGQLGPATPPQLSPVKPRRHRAPARRRQQPDVAALSSELSRLLNNSSGAPGARTVADWTNLPPNVWELVWRDHLDLPAQMALCLTTMRRAVKLAAFAVFVSLPRQASTTRSPSPQAVLQPCCACESVTDYCLAVS